MVDSWRALVSGRGPSGDDSSADPKLTIRSSRLVHPPVGPQFRPRNQVNDGSLATDSVADIQRRELDARQWWFGQHCSMLGRQGTRWHQVLDWRRAVG